MTVRVTDPTGYTGTDAVFRAIIEWHHPTAYSVGPGEVGTITVQGWPHVEAAVESVREGAPSGWDVRIEPRKVPRKHPARSRRWPDDLRTTALLRIHGMRP